MLRNALSWELDPHPPPRNANNVEHYTFVTLCSGKCYTIPVRSHLVGWGPTRFCSLTQFPITSGGRTRVCSDSRPCVLMCRTCSASSLASSVSRQVQCGRYCPGGAGMKSRMRRPKMISAGLTLDTGAGVFMLANMARWNASVFREPLEPVLPTNIRMTVFMPSSAMQLLCVWRATLLTRWCTPQLRRNVSVAPAMNSGPPSDESSSAMPKVTNTAECSNTSFGAVCILFYHGPIGVPIHDDEVMVTAVAEVVCTYCLEGVDWSNWRCRWRIWLGRCHAIARCTPCTRFFDCRCHARPEEWTLRSRHHHRYTLVSRVYLYLFLYEDLGPGREDLSGQSSVLCSLFKLCGGFIKKSTIVIKSIYRPYIIYFKKSRQNKLENKTLHIQIVKNKLFKKLKSSRLF